MKTTGKIFLVMITALFSVTTHASEWRNISNYNQATSLAVKGQEVWIAAKGGLSMLNQTSGNLTHFRKSPTELPSLAVERVLVHPITGDIWIGTYDNGIAKFDGNNWTQIALPNTEGVLYEMKIANDGTVWALTSTGLYAYNNGNFTSYLTSAINSPSLCWDFDLMSNGKLLCSHFEPFLFDPISNTTQPLTTSGFAYSTSRVLVIDNSHFAFASDHGELALFTDTSETDTFHLSSIPSDMQIHNGNLLVLTEASNELMELSNNTWNTLTLGDSTLTAFTISNNAIWAGAGYYKNKLYHQTSPSTHTTFDLTKTGINSNQILCLKNTSDGNLLITHGNGIQVFNLAENAFDSSKEIVAPNIGITEAIDWNGKIYAGTNYRYLYEYSPSGSYQALGVAVLPDNQVDHLTKDTHGNLWMCGPGYIAKYNGSYFTIYDQTNNPNLTSNLYLRDIHFDVTRNLIWVASYDGIFKIENGTVSFYNENTPGFLQFYDAVETISEDADHNIWFGTVYGGVIKFDGNSFSSMLLPVHVGNQFVSGIAFDGNIMYLSDNLNGIWKYENGTFDSINVLNSSLSTNYVRTLLTDKNGNLWIGSVTYGLDVYNKNEIALSNNDPESDISMSIFPNPSNGIFTLHQTSAEKLSIQVFGLDGSLVKSYISSGNRTIIDISDEAKGLYILQVSGSNIQKTLKISFQ